MSPKTGFPGNKYRGFQNLEEAKERGAGGYPEEIGGSWALKYVAAADGLGAEIGFVVLV